MTILLLRQHVGAIAEAPGRFASSMKRMKPGFTPIAVDLEPKLEAYSLSLGFKPGPTETKSVAVDSDFLRAEKIARIYSSSSWARELATGKITRYRFDAAISFESASGMLLVAAHDRWPIHLQYWFFTGDAEVASVLGGDGFESRDLRPG